MPKFTGDSYLQYKIKEDGEVFRDVVNVEFDMRTTNDSGLLFWIGSVSQV